MDLLIKVLAFIVIFGSVVLLHELGHFIVARLNDIEVREFMIGFGPKLFKVQGKETEYSIRLIPLGGAVVMIGEEDFDESPRSYSNKPIWRRLLVLVAGPLMNFVLAILLFFFAFTVNGLATTKVTELIPGMPAIEQGVKEGDLILEIDGQKMKKWDEIIGTIGNSNGKELTLKVDRNGETKEIKVKPVLDQDIGSRYIIGMRSYEAGDPVTGIKHAWTQTWDVAYRTLVFIPKMFVKPELLEQVSGLVGIANIIGKSTEYGIWALIYLTALISISLGVFNLLPIVPLDGGKIFLLIIELVIRRPIGEKFEKVVSYAGLLFVIGLMILATFMDIKHIVAPN